MSWKPDVPYHHCPQATRDYLEPWRFPARVRRDSSRFLYAARRNCCLPRNFIIAENWRRFWRRTVFP